MELTDNLRLTCYKLKTNWKEFYSKYDEIVTSQHYILMENYEKGQAIDNLTNQLKSATSQGDVSNQLGFMMKQYKKDIE